MSEGDEAPQALAARVRESDRDAVARALNLVDDRRGHRRASALELLNCLARAERTDPARPDPRSAASVARPHGRRIGVTGAPGAGKSTLLDALATALLARGRSVSILAVDPSSRKTGGALLGDRFRMGAAARDAGVFFRSLAARDQLGGLSEITGASLDVLAAGFYVALVETVGVGQSESNVADLVETLVFVAQPAAGDLIQFMKAGLMELPDVFFVNKADLDGLAARTAAELKAGLDLGRGGDGGARAPVLCGSARDGTGIGALIDALDAHHAELARSGEGERRRAAQRAARVRSALLQRHGTRGLERLAAEASLDALVAASTGTSVERLVDDLGARIERAFAAGSR